MFVPEKRALKMVASSIFGSWIRFDRVVMLWLLSGEAVLIRSAVSVLVPGTTLIPCQLIACRVSVDWCVAFGQLV